MALAALTGGPVPLGDAWTLSACGLHIPSLPYYGARLVVAGAVPNKDSQAGLDELATLFLTRLQAAHDHDPGWRTVMPSGHPAGARRTGRCPLG